MFMRTKFCFVIGGIIKKVRGGGMNTKNSYKGDRLEKKIMHGVNVK